ncbi:hypothetical protein ACJJTC_014814, partial [Scirpophaga incertulas]
MDLGPLTLLQGNINHSAAAQDLLCATAAEWRAGLAIVAEPYYVPPQSDNWLQSTDGTAAIVRVGCREQPLSRSEREGERIHLFGIPVCPDGGLPDIPGGPKATGAPRWAPPSLGGRSPSSALKWRREAAMVRAWSDPPAHIAGDVDGMAELFADDMGGRLPKQAMPRTRACPDRGGKFKSSAPLHLRYGQGAAGPGDRGLCSRILVRSSPPEWHPRRLLRRLPRRVVPPVSDEEFDMVRDRLRRKKKAPGPDGVLSRVLALALGHLEERFRA